MSTREYEAMFLLDNTAATADFEATAAQVDKILEKHGSELVHNEKWDERRLAYEIKGHRRATYYLVYFRAPSSAIVEIDRDAALNEVILRYLAIALDEPIDEYIKNRADDREKMAEESRRSSLSGWGDRKGGRSERNERGERDRPPREATPEGSGSSGEAASGDETKVAETKVAETKVAETNVAVTSAESAPTDAGTAG